ncbi:MAG: FxSxx-COOH system tetratricopeptide repeat protein [Candidatus Cybelea sp.]
MPVRKPLPSGAVTFAFTDIEGSTARWERDGAAMQEAVRRHDAIVRGAIEQSGGHVFKTIGDAFCSAFARPEDAAAAMLAAQRTLILEDFSAVDGLRVRAAIHTGTADKRERDYFGPVVNKVARLLAIGHGGQVLLTAETATLVEATLPENASLTDLGAYHLKDFSEPQRVFAILAPGLPAEFPPLRSLGTLPSDLSIVDAAEFHSVPSFSGREDDLAAISAALQSDNAVAVVQGLGGVGKSSVVREYGWRNRDRYSVLWWLNAQTEDGIIDGLLRLGTMFMQGLDKLADRRVAAQRVINSVLGGFDKPALLVFDNLEDEALMRSWLPRSGTRALATSRDTALSGDMIAIPLQVWEIEAAIAYLQHASGRTDLNEADARAIAETLGALPLAMAHAAASLRNLRMISPQRYLEHIDEHLKKAPRGADYPRSVFATFRTAIAQAEEQAPGAAAALCFATFFAPDGIPDELFRQPIDLYPERLQPVISGHEALDLRSALVELRLDDALGALDRLSLLTFSQSSRTYTMHRLVQLAGKDSLVAQHGWQECALQVVNSVFPEVEFATWPQCERLLPHARATLANESVASESKAAARLADRCAVYLRERGDYRVAQILHAQALDIWERVSGQDHPDFVAGLNNLAILHAEQGRYREAETLLRRILAIREKAFGANHLDLASSLNSLAMVLQEQGRYEEAEPLHLRARMIWEATLGEEHPNVATSFSNLALLYNLSGRREEAEDLQIRALAIREKALGLNHPHVANSLNNLAQFYFSEGDYEKAAPLDVRALAIFEKTLGLEHPSVADSLGNLAGNYHGLGRHAEAEALLLRALAIREKSLDPAHRNVAMNLDDLAGVYEAQGRLKEAESLRMRAVSIWEATFEPGHPDVEASLEGLADLYVRERRFQEAMPLYQRIVTTREQRLGHDHPLTKELLKKTRSL